MNIGCKRVFTLNLLLQLNYSVQLKIFFPALLILRYIKETLTTIDKSTYSQISSHQCAGFKADIVFLCDGSKKMGEHDFEVAEICIQIKLTSLVAVIGCTLYMLYDSCLRYIAHAGRYMYDTYVTMYHDFNLVREHSLFADLIAITLS